MGKKNALAMLLNQIFLQSFNLNDWDYFLDKFVDEQKIKNLSHKGHSNLKGNANKSILDNRNITWRKFVYALRIMKRVEFQLAIRIKDPLGKIETYTGDWIKVVEEYEKEGKIDNNEETKENVE